MALSYIYLDPLIDPVELVLDIRRVAVSQWQQGRVTMKYTGEGTEFQKVFAAPTEVILAETRHYLKTYDPRKYGYILSSVKQVRV